MVAASQARGDFEPFRSFHAFKSVNRQQLFLVKFANFGGKLDFDDGLFGSIRLSRGKAGDANMAFASSAHSHTPFAPLKRMLEESEVRTPRNQGIALRVRGIRKDEVGWTKLLM